MPDGAYDATEELADLFDDGPVSVKIGRHTFMVRHLEMRELMPASNALRVALAAMNGGAESEAFMAEHVDEVIPLLASAIGRPVEVIERLRGDVKLTLFAALLHVNRNFFVKAADLVLGDTAALVVGMFGVGQEQSATSAITDTPTASTTRPRDSSGA